MKDALNVFNSLIGQCSIIMGIYEYLESTVSSIDPSDLLRWQYVIAVAALDKYIHDIVRIGMVEEFQGKRLKTKSYNAVKFDLSTMSLIINSPNPDVEFSNEIIRQQSYKAFQDPDRISDALSLIWDEDHKWRVISSHMKTTISEVDLKTKLKNIVIRRNQIVHQGDYSTTQPPLQQQMIIKSDTQEVIDFIKEIVFAIDSSI